MVDKSTDSGNDMMVAQFVFLFLRARFPEKLQPKWTSKTVNAVVKKQIDNNFPRSVLLSTIEMKSKC